MESFEAV